MSIAGAVDCAAALAAPETASDAVFQQMLPHSPLPRAVEDVPAYLDRVRLSEANGARVAWCVADRETDVALGNVALFEFDTDEPDGTAQVGYWAHPEGRGRGVMAAAVDAVSTWSMGSQDEGGYRFLARSPGFPEDWLAEAERLCTGFGERPADIHCPGAVFALPFARKQVAVVQVADQGRDDAGRPGALAFRLLVLPAGLLWRRTRGLAAAATAALVLSIQLGARELGFALVFASLLLTFAPPVWARRALPLQLLVLAVMLAATAVAPGQALLEEWHLW